MSTALDEPMAKSKGRPRKPSGEGSLVRIDSDIVSMARYLSARQDRPISEMFSSILRPVIDQEFRKVTREMLEGEAEVRKSRDVLPDQTTPPKAKGKGKGGSKE